MVDSQRVTLRSPCPIQSLRERLAVLRELSVNGRQAEAELEAHDLAVSPEAPVTPSLRLLLASWFGRRGAWNEARCVVEPLKWYDTTREGAEAIDADLAYLAAPEFSRAHQPNPNASAPLLATPLAEAYAAEDRILAGQLLDRPELIASLTAGLLIGNDEAQRCQLRRSLAIVADELIDTGWGLDVTRSLARLALHAHANSDAKHWAARGLADHPGDEHLALLLDEADREESSDLEPAPNPIADDAQPVVHPWVTPAEALTAAYDAHPTYPDVATALVRRLVRDGRTDLAREQMDKVQHSAIADHPIVLRLASEWDGPREGSVAA